MDLESSSLTDDCINITMNDSMNVSMILLHLEHQFVFKIKCLTTNSSGSLEFIPGF